MEGFDVGGCESAGSIGGGDADRPTVDYRERFLGCLQALLPLGDREHLSKVLS
ncbi:MAG: hypothetical protein V3T83_11825 [Acidobacteriota bacterium]